MKTYVRILLRYRLPVLAIILVITAFFGYYARSIITDNSIEIWLSKNDKDLNYYKIFLNKFGNEEFLVVVFSAANIFTKAHIREINTIAEKIKMLDGVISVFSLADVLKDKVASPSFREKMKSQHNRPLLAVFKQQLRNDPMYQKTIISMDGKTTGIIATVKSLSPETRKHLVSEVRMILRETSVSSSGSQGPNCKYYLAGPSVVNAELDHMAEQDMARFTPFMFVMSIVVLGCLFRNISGVVIPVLTIGLCILWAAGCYALCGQSMNMISNMILPLTFIISLSTSIHLISHYYHETEFITDKENAIYTTIRHVGVPIFMTTVTTIIGFVSLATSTIPPVFITGLFMAGCAAFTFIISMTLIPILLSFVPFHKAIHTDRSVHKKAVVEVPLQKDYFDEEDEEFDNDRGIGLFLSRIGRFTVNHKGLILACGLAVSMVFFWGISKLRVESDIITSFPKKSLVVKDNAYIEKHLMGLLPVEIIAETTNGISILQPNTLNNLVMLQKYLCSVPEVTGSLSAADYIQKVHQIVKGDKQQYYTIPDTEKEAVNFIKLASLYGDSSVNKLCTKEHTDARISVRMKQVGSNRYQAIIQSIQDYIQKHLDTTSLSWHITGIVPLLINVQDNILKSEIQSFSLAFVLTFISTAVVLRSVRIGLISVIPNLLPITITLGLMGFTGMKLDAATIMIASIALGISVDNTIHIFYRFKKELSVDENYSKTVCRTLQGVGKTALFTSLSAAFGFMVFSFSSFKPIQYFGVLTSVTLLNAIVADLLISPSCLMLFKPKLRILNDSQSNKHQ